MKKAFLNILLILILFLSFSILLQAQKDSEQFHLLYKEGKFVEAAQEIDRLINGNTNAGALLFYYKSDVNLILFKNSKPANPNFLDISSTAMSTAIAQKDYIQNRSTIDMLCYAVGKECFVTGAGEFNSGNFKDAQKRFQYTAEFYKTAGKSGELTQILFYLALSAKYNKDVATAQKNFQLLANQNFPEPDVYIMLADIYRGQNNLQKSLEVLNSASKLNLKNMDKILREIIFLNFDLKNFDETLKIIGIYKTKYNPDYEILFSEGVIYFQKNLLEDAKSSFKNVLNLQPGHFSANYNLGIIYYNNSIAIMKNAEDNFYGDADKYRAEKEKYLENIKISLQYMEKAHSIQTNEKSTISCLADIYKRLQRTDEYNAMMKLMEN